MLYYPHNMRKYQHEYMMVLSSRTIIRDKHGLYNMIQLGEKVRPDFELLIAFLRGMVLI